MKSVEPYLSVYEYTGRASSFNGIGKEVNDAAQRDNIKVVWRDLPIDVQRENYKQVATYPKSFLDKHFGNDPAPQAYMIDQIYQKLVELETKFNLLIYKLDNQPVHVDTDDDELPF
jgi:uncharacterized protein YaaN involved in tellurite resistance